MKVDFTNEEVDYLIELFNRVQVRSKSTGIETPMAVSILDKILKAQENSRIPEFVPRKYVKED